MQIEIGQNLLNIIAFTSMLTFLTVIAALALNARGKS